MKKSPALVLQAGVTAFPAPNADGFSDCDGYRFQLVESINKASTVALYRGKELTAGQARSIKRAIDGVSQMKAEGLNIAPTYGDMEKYLIEVGGDEVTRMHSGRSTVDINRTRARMEQRHYTIKLIEETVRLRHALLELAEKHIEHVMPAYTLGVQAQPTTVAHFLSAYCAGLARVAARAEHLYSDVNQSPLGAGVLGSSSFNNDRAYLGSLLGFEGVVENAFDAVQISSLDTGMHIMGVATGAAAIAGQLISDLLVQYRTPNPWFVLEADGRSTAMPQKRNPEKLNDAMFLANSIYALQTAFAFKAANLPQGFPQGHNSDDPVMALQKAAELLNLTAVIVSTVKVDKARARQEVTDEYSTATSLAEVLQQKGGLPYRSGYYYTSDLVAYMRARNIKVLDISYADARRIFEKVSRERGFAIKDLPLSEQQFRSALSPEGMMQGRSMTGGTQATSVRAYLSVQKVDVSRTRKWVDQAIKKLKNAEKLLAKTYGELENGEL